MSADLMAARLTTLLQRRLSGRMLHALGLVCLGLAVGLFLLGAGETGVRGAAWALAGVQALGGMALYALAPHVEARRLVRLAHRLITTEEYPAALEAARRAIELVPYLANAYVARSAAYVGLGQIDMAVDDAEQAVRVAPRKPEARLARARLFSYRGLHEDAIRDLGAGLRERPDWATGHLEMARLYVKLEDYEHSLAALEALDQRVTSLRARYDAMILAGWVYEDKLRDLDKAIERYTRAIPLLPDRKIGYLRRALAYHRRGDARQAAEDLLRAAECQPTPEDAGYYHWLRAACYGRRYTITRDPRDLRAWIAALERSARDDAPDYAQQAQRWLQVIRDRPQWDDLPPPPIFYPN